MVSNNRLSWTQATPKELQLLPTFKGKGKLENDGIDMNGYNNFIISSRYSVRR